VYEKILLKTDLNLRGDCISDILADDFIFENSDRTQKGKESILITMAGDDSFTVGDWVV
jgi:hypothetical protein